MRGLHKQMLIFLSFLIQTKKINLKICVETVNSVIFFLQKLREIKLFRARLICVVFSRNFYFLMKTKIHNFYTV